ncbi:MAG: TRAP transporter substrate-binding protein [Desulfovibrio sp.]|uniref:TRAP transporter substrate-binding protein n=1 Tax=Desulfovibrio sp. TaxID=885 RepID=UPI001A6B033A|nr:TRAP transporter substrate-binding protein [Desulfovibrio sp.]MBD5417048.1 TRAP transporter substrate-binding protein [Desulfovibrio sp.]
MSFKKLCVLTLAFLFMLTVSAQAAVNYKVAVGDPEDSEQGVAALAFKAYVEKETKGEVQIDLFFAGALGDESEAFRNVQKGTLPFAVGGIANLVPFEKKLGLLTLPYLFENLDEVVKGTNGKPAELLNSYATKAGFRILCWTYTDFRYISNSKHPIKKLDDIKDLKFRVPQSAVLIAAYKAFGGSPTPISWAETFTALQQGVVDGQCYGYIGFKAMKFNEANQKYLTEVHYTYQLQPLVMSERVYKKTKPELQKIFVDGGLFAQEAVLKYQKEYAQAAKDELIAGGLVVDMLEDEEAWKKAAYDKVWPEMADFVGGKDAINEYLKAMGKEPWQN